MLNLRASFYLHLASFQREYFNGKCEKYKINCRQSGSSVHGIFPGSNTGMGCHFLLQRIFPTQGLKPRFLHWQTNSLPLSHREASQRHRKEIKNYSFFHSLREIYNSIPKIWFSFWVCFFLLFLEDSKSVASMVLQLSRYHGNMGRPRTQLLWQLHYKLHNRWVCGKWSHEKRSLFWGSSEGAHLQKMPVLYPGPNEHHFHGIWYTWFWKFVICWNDSL